MVSAAFRTIFALSEPAAVTARWDEVADTLEARFPKAAASMREAKLDVPPSLRAGSADITRRDGGN